MTRNTHTVAELAGMIDDHASDLRGYAELAKHHADCAANRAAELTETVTLIRETSDRLMRMAKALRHDPDSASLIELRG